MATTEVFLIFSGSAEIPPILAREATHDAVVSKRALPIAIDHPSGYRATIRRGKIFVEPIVAKPTKPATPATPEVVDRGS